jgi:Rrf2 family protein
MFGPSVTAAYATRALVCLAKRGGWVRGADVIASCSGAPKPYLVKLLHALARGGLLTTKRGYRGGYGLAREPERINLYDIVTAVDGTDAFERCLLGLGRCSAKRNCPVHPLWSKQRARVRKRYQKLTLRDLASFDRWHVGRDYSFGLRGEWGRSQRRGSGR